MFELDLLRRLHRYCFALTHDVDAAHDLLQDGVERYLKSPPFRDTGDGAVNEAYLRRILRNRYLDQWRHRARFSELHFEESQHAPVVALHEPHAGSIPIDDSIDIEAMFSKLPPADRELLFLWAYEDLSSSEIAELTGVPRGTVLSRLHRLRTRLERETQPQERATGNTPARIRP